MVGDPFGGDSKDRIVTFLTPCFAGTFLETGACESEAFLFLLTTRIKVRLEMEYQSKIYRYEKESVIEKAQPFGRNANLSSLFLKT